jgi:hypothetical protein
LARIAGVLCDRISAGISAHLRTPSSSDTDLRSRTHSRMNFVKQPAERGCDVASSGSGQASPV